MTITQSQKEIIEAVIESVYSEIDIEGDKQITLEGLRNFIKAFKATLKCRSIRDAEADFKIFFQYHHQPLPMYNILELGDKNITAQEVRDYMFELIDAKVQTVAKHLGSSVNDFNWNIEGIKKIKPDNISLGDAINIIKNSIHDKAEATTKYVAEQVKHMPTSHKLSLGALCTACIASTTRGEVTSLYVMAIGAASIGAAGIIDGSRKIAQEYLHHDQGASLGISNENGLTR